MSSKWQRSWAIELLWFMTSQCASEFCLQLVYSKKPEMGYNTTAQTSQVVRKRIAKITCQIRLHFIIWMDLPWWGLVMKNIFLIEINIHLSFVCKKKSTRQVAVDSFRICRQFLLYKFERICSFWPGFSECFSLVPSNFWKQRKNDTYVFIFSVLSPEKTVREPEKKISENPSLY